MTERAPSAAWLDKLKAYSVAHAHDQRLVFQATLLLLHQGHIGQADAMAYLRRVLKTASFYDFYGFVVALAVVSRGAPIPQAAVSTNTDVRLSYPILADWINACLGRRQPSIPPLDKLHPVLTNRIALLALVGIILDDAERHLFAIRALEEARFVALIRTRLNHTYQKTSPRWYFSDNFLKRIGHCVVSAAMLELRRRGRLPDQELQFLSSTPHNPHLYAQFAGHVIDRLPADALHVEIMSGHKRFVMADGSEASMTDILSEAARIWHEAGCSVIDPVSAVADRGRDLLAEHGIAEDAPVVTLHVREAGYRPEAVRSTQLRDGTIDDYDPAIDDLIARGYHVVRLGDPSMARARPRKGLFDYPFTPAKSDWMDIYLASRCRFHIGTASGMSYVPLLFGRPILFTNWVTLSHLICATNVVTLPKVLRDHRGVAVPFADYCNRHGRIYEWPEAALHGLAFENSDPADILESVRFVADHLDAGSGRLVFDGNPFAGIQERVAASDLGTRPQIAPAFLRRAGIVA